MTEQLPPPSPDEPDMAVTPDYKRPLRLDFMRRLPSGFGGMTADEAMVLIELDEAQEAELIQLFEDRPIFPPSELRPASGI